MKSGALAWLCSVVVGVGWLGAHAQAKPAQTAAAPTFSTRTELVLVPAVVTDHKGAHIPGLTREDFLVLENGIEQKVATFEEVKPTAAPVRQLNAPTPPLEFTNMRPADFQPRRINIIVLDTLNTAFSDQAYARQQLLKYLSTSIRADQLTTLLLFTRGGIKVIHDFTTDTAVLMQALKRHKGVVGPMEGEDVNAIGTDPLSSANASQALVQSESDRISDMMEHIEATQTRLQLEYTIQATIDCFEAIAHGYAGVPGRKSLIWITGSFPFMLERPGDTVSSSFQMRRERLFQDLNSANISVYPVDARGLVSGAISGSTNVPASAMRRGGAGLAGMQRSMRQTHTDTLATLTEVADMTGGRAFYNTNDLAHALENADTDSSAYYLLGYYVRTGEGKPGWRKLAVKVKRNGVQVRARSGYFVTRDPKLPEDVRKQEIVTALNSPFESTALPLSVRWTGQSAADASNRFAKFEVYLDAGKVTIEEADHNHVDLDFVAVASTPELKLAGDVGQEINTHLTPDDLARLRSARLTYKNQLKVPPGQYTVKFVVRDNLNGRVGSVSAPLSVR